MAMFQLSSVSPLIVHEKLYGLLAPIEWQTATPIPDDVWVDTVLGLTYSELCE